jgi:hypothetical protein
MLRGSTLNQPCTLRENAQGAFYPLIYFPIYFPIYFNDPR